MLILLRFVFLGKDEKPNDINGCIVKSDRLLAALHPSTDAQTQALAAARATVDSIGQSRLQMSFVLASPISIPLIVIVVAWATLLFFGYGLRPAHSRRHLYVTRYTEGFSHFVTSMTAPVASGWSVRRVGLAPTGKRRLLTAHTFSGHSG